MDRRDFLMLRVGADDTYELSCERLYMRYVDAETDGAVDRLFANLGHDLDPASAVRLVGTEWLADDALNRRLNVVLADFRSRGGRLLRARETAKEAL